MPNERPQIMQIEKGVPLPKRGATSGHEISILLDALEVGDSFVFPYPKNQKNQNPFGQKFVVRRPKKFAQRRIDDEHLRIWRIA